MTPIQGLFLAAAALALSAAVVPLRAETSGGEVQQLDTVQQQIETSQQAQERIAAEIAAALRDQDSVASKLIDISQKIQTQEAAISANEDELLRLNKEQVVLMADLGEKRGVLSELLAGLQRLEQNPPPALVVEPHDVLSALRGAMMFGTIVPELRDEADKLVAELARIDELRATIATRKKDLGEEIARLEASRGDLSGLIAQKKDMVSRGNADLEAERQRTGQLAAKAQTLKQLLASLAEDRKKADAESARQAAADETERKRQEEIQRRPRLAFAKAQGQLNYPAQGQMLRGFGDPDGSGGQSQGTIIATRTSAQVTAPADGQVEFAGAFRSYGQVVILNPGGGYRILLAGMRNITAATGEFLRAGEPLGEMGDGPSSVTLLGDVVQDGRPVLYIEFRNSTDAIDSGPWWIGGMKEARG